VAKVDLGEKQVCPECEKKFYDLTKNPAVCPYCQNSFDPSTIVGKAAPVVVEAVKKEVEVEEAETEEDIDEDEAAAKELELDGDSATFGGADGNDGDDEAPGTPDNMDGFSTSDDDDETSALDDEDDERPPTGDDDDDVEEVEI